MNKIDWDSGIAMMVSVGTFLYVVTIHILPEVFMCQHDHGHDHIEENGKHNISSDKHFKHMAYQSSDINQGLERS